MSGFSGGGACDRLSSGIGARYGHYNFTEWIIIYGASLIYLSVP